MSSRQKLWIVAVIIVIISLAVDIVVAGNAVAIIGVILLYLLLKGISVWRG